MVLDQIDYKNVFHYFEEISNIPRGSGNNQPMSDYLIAFAKERGLSYTRDEALNVIITKEATAGYETCPTLILQGHMDMVCEKKSETDHDFLTQGLDLCIEDDFIYAKGTTLGGDDGVAVAYILAILDSETIEHPRLEMVITTDEEIGLIGATNLDASSLQGTFMINLDSEEEDILLTSCAGGMSSVCKLPLSYKKTEGKKVSVIIKGLLGGHSGAEIDKKRVNADILLGRLLMDLSKYPFELLSIEGGLKDNAIPREAVAELVVKEEDSYGLINEIKFLSEKYKNEYRTNEPDLAIGIQQGEEREYLVLDERTKENVMFFLLQAPNGIQTMSSNIEGLVESSLNLGILRMSEEEIEFSFSVRSSVSSYKWFLSEKLKNLITFLGGTYDYHGEYPGWEFKKNSKLRDIYCNSYKEMFGKDIKVEAIHAGLECGIIAEKLDNLDIISIGPNIYDIHTTEERLSISSTKRIFDLLLKVLKDFAEATK